MNQKLRITFIFLLTLFSLVPSYTQSIRKIELPYPQIGWDSLKTKIFYPDIAKRANLWGSFDINVEIDSLGKMISFKVNFSDYELNDYISEIKKDSLLFVRYLNWSFNNVMWEPGQIDGEPKTMKITIPIVFYFEERRQAVPTIFIKTKPQYPILD